jgi:hypothetical protein
MYACLFSLQNKLDKNDEFNALKTSCKTNWNNVCTFFSLQNKLDKNDEFNALKISCNHLWYTLNKRKEKTKQENYLCVKAKTNLKYVFQSILLGLASLE